jgi:4'-phosphopantetheinyl transferase
MTPALPRFPDLLELSPEVVEVVRVDLRRGTDVRDLERFLSSDERSRTRAFAFRGDVRRYVAARAALRKILGACLRLHPGAVRLEAARGGKPRLAAAHEAPLDFNVSHSHDLAAIAVAVGRDVGIDVERAQGVCGDLRAIADRFFSCEEARGLAAIPGSEYARAFFRCWTCKESYLKARGCGLSLPLSSFTVETDARRPPGLLGHRASPGERERWRMEHVELDVAYECTVTAQGRSWRVRRWDAPL